MNTFCYTSVMVCSDCHIPVVQGDFTALDFHYQGDEADQRMNEIEAGIASLTEDIGFLSAGEEQEEFSVDSCACCGSPEAGPRFEIIGTETVSAVA